jgi:hypothetical protein
MPIFLPSFSKRSLSELASFSMAAETSGAGAAAAAGGRGAARRGPGRYGTAAVAGQPVAALDPAGRRRHRHPEHDHPEVDDHPAVGATDETPPALPSGGQDDLAQGGPAGEAAERERRQGRPAVGADDHGERQ